MKTKIVTCIYSNLHGTDLGGRPSRGTHYRYSLLSLLKMTEANCVCYTSEEEYEDLIKFFNDHDIGSNRLIFKIFDLKNFILTNKINKIKNIEETKRSDRCIEIQYSKFIWLLNEADAAYENLYWMDAGLSHTGLFPTRHMGHGDYGSVYFNCSLFDNQFLNNLISFASDSIFLIAKENLNNFWSNTVPHSYYNSHCMDYHIIGGVFGGKTDKSIEYCNLFLDYANKLLDNEQNLYFEEHIMSLMFYNHPLLFKAKYFDIWWHEDARIPGLDLNEYTKTRKSFYKIIEEIHDNIY